MTDVVTRLGQETRTDDAARRAGRTTAVWRGLSVPGLIVGLVFFVLSLLPSMLPRAVAFQGLASGITVMIGYALGTAGQWLWNILGLPQPRGRAGTVITGAVLVVLALVVGYGTWQHVEWQNEVRSIYGLDPITPAVLLPALAIAAVVAAVVLAAARALRTVLDVTSAALGRILPRRVAPLAGAVAVVVLMHPVSSDVLVTGSFAASNQVFSARDTGTAEGVVRPDSAFRSGGPGSHVTWESLGRQGRAFVSTGPTVDEINAFTGGGAIEPIRVYAGLRSAASLQARADLVLDELIRTGAFDREALVVGTTTGTGYFDAAGVDPIEFLHNGDTAIVGVQYSYLPSWISLLADQDKVRRTARVVFEAVHDHWSTLPASARPEFYLYGLSLGSYGAESVLTSIDLPNEPIDGALLVGPPFVSELWNRVVDDRREGTPPWLPIHGNGTTVRFTGEDDALDRPGGEWGPPRIVYLQHASDPVVFFSSEIALTMPDWLRDGQRGPGIADDFVWMPLVTFWQMAFDLASAGSVPRGWGHMYTPGANGAAWVAVARPDNWSPADTQALRDHLDERHHRREARTAG